MPMDYFVWAVVGPTGRGWSTPASASSTPSAGTARLLRSAADGLALIGIDAATVTDVVITHLHYDHVGGFDQFPSARFHVQDREIAFATGRHMTEPSQQHAFTPDHVADFVLAVHDGRVVFHDGDAQLAPGLIGPPRRRSHRRAAGRARAHRAGLARARLRRDALLRELRAAAAVPDRLRRRHDARRLRTRPSSSPTAPTCTSPATIPTCSSATPRSPPTSTASPSASHERVPETHGWCLTPARVSDTGRFREGGHESQRTLGAGVRHRTRCQTPGSNP